MQLAPYTGTNNSKFGDNDCIKCGTCVAACPKKVLSFEPEKEIFPVKAKAEGTARKQRVQSKAA
jgi:ferredoxin